MACGADLLLEAIAASILAFIILIVLRFGEQYIMHHQGSDAHHLHIEVASLSGSLLSQVYDTCTHTSIVVESLKVYTEQGLNTIESFATFQM